MTHNCNDAECSACSSQEVSVKSGAFSGEYFCESGFLNLAKKRFSVRRYKDIPVKSDIIDTIIEAGRVAPTGANLQAYKVVVIRSKSGMEKLAKGAKNCGAPNAFIICSEKGKSFKRPFDGKLMSDIDASIVTDHMMLAATDLGLGTLWMTYFDPQIIRDEFNIPDTFEPVNILLAGYSDEKEASPDRHKTMRRKRIDMVVEEAF